MPVKFTKRYNLTAQWHDNKTRRTTRKTRFQHSWKSYDVMCVVYYLECGPVLPRNVTAPRTRTWFITMLQRHRFVHRRMPYIICQGIMHREMFSLYYILRRRLWLFLINGRVMSDCLLKCWGLGIKYGSI